MQGEDCGKMTVFDLQPLKEEEGHLGEGNWMEAGSEAQLREGAGLLCRGVDGGMAGSRALVFKRMGPLRWGQHSETRLKSQHMESQHN